MNGVHDMGGMHNLGVLDIETEEPVFHATWEGRVFGLVMSWSPWVRYRQFGSFRYALERLDPASYLSWSYYEKWFYAHELKALQTGLVTREELQRGHADPDNPVPVLDSYEAGQPGSRKLGIDVKTQFTVGDRARVRNLHPPGHCRLPGYLRGKTGSVIRDNGAYAPQDTDTSGVRLTSTARHVYTVRFSARTLWGDSAHARDSVNVDLWEDYLETAGQ